MSDTIGATLPQALRVVVRDSHGAPVPNAVVTFTALLDSTVGASHAFSFPVPSVQLVPVNALYPNEPPGGSIEQTTSAQGTVSGVDVQLGSIAGPAGVIVAVASAGYVDTVRYTIRPGAAAALRVTPADTVLLAGTGTLTLTSVVLDRAGNVRDGAVTYRAGGPTVGVTSTGQVTAPAPTRAVVVVTSPGVAAPESAYVSAVPSGTIAVRRNSTLVISQLDGGNAREFTPPGGILDPSPEWQPQGQSLLAVIGTTSQPTTAATLNTLDLQGAAQSVIAPQPNNGPVPVPGEVRSFAYSPDGQWVYLSADNCNADGILYRVRVGSSAAPERLSPIIPSQSSLPQLDDCSATVHLWPSPAPDGTRLVYENDSTSSNGFTLRLLNLATRAVTPLNVQGQRPRWSPQGDLIAYYNNGQIWVVRPDGTGQRAVSPAGHPYVAGATWSPDAKYLLARASLPPYATPTVVLLDVQGGTEIPLAFLDDRYGLPVWRPDS